ncbi:MAG: pentapeptide repeat-containing protein [Planctomycetota bacterium]|nr:pentapeptide repeat-containing protein [Planctomycetota bacterium]
MERVALSPQEIAKLADVGEFNRSHGRRQFALSDRVVGEQRWAGLAMVGATLSNLTLNKTVLDGLQLSLSKVGGVNVVAGSLAGARVEKTTFENCRFTCVSAGGAVFSECSFRRCVFIEGAIDGAQFRHCTFEECSWQSTPLSNGVLHGVVFTGSLVENSMFRRCEVTSTEFRDCQLASVVFDAIHGGKLLVSGGKLDRCGINTSSYGPVAIARAVVRQFTFESCELREALVEACPSVHALRFNSCTLAGAQIKDSKEVIELFFNASIASALAMTDNELIWPRFWESKLEQASIERVAFEGCDFTASTVSALTLKGCTFTAPVALADTVFSKLKLVTPTYAADYRGRASHVTYIESDRFKDT